MIIWIFGPAAVWLSVRVVSCCALIVVISRENERGEEKSERD